MQHQFIIDPLDCAHCADKIARKVSALQGVQKADITFMTGKLIVESDRGDDLLADVERIVQRVEPQAKVRKI